ncbi:hypothetical protein FBQ85_10230, partial [Cytophagia bacterium CHB2]|nr:hypothetical protein [Cytophagia bacterium CHB2]
VETAEAKVPFKETVKGSAKAQGRHKRQTGGRGQFGDCWLELEPLERGSGFQFDNKVVGGSIPKNYIPAVEKGVREALEGGLRAGFQVVDVRATVYDGSYHEVDSSEMAFKIAGALAFRAAAEKADPTILEPIVNVEVDVPDETATQRVEQGESGVDALCLVASGRRVYAMDPLRQKSLEDLPLDLNFDPGRLGSLRSVRMGGEGRDRLCLAGARNGVYTMLLAHRKAAREYPIGSNVEARTGVNAAVLYRNFIYATHSEFGLLRWPLLQPYSPAVHVMPDLTSRFSTTRGLTLFDERLLFANGPTVLLLEQGLAHGAALRVAARYPGTRHEVTALAHDGQYVLVADAAGDVYVWEPRQGTPPLLAFRAGKAVGELAATTLSGDRKCLLVALKSTVMPMLFQDGSTAREFIAPEPIRSCDVLEGVVVGLSRDRMRVFAWRENRPEWPQWQFQFTEPVLDLRLVTPREIAAGNSSRQPAVQPGHESSADSQAQRHKPLQRPPSY